MIVACPHCKTTYNLPDDKARPQSKLRCTVCRQVFYLAESMEAAEKGAAAGPLDMSGMPSVSDGPSSGLNEVLGVDTASAFDEGMSISMNQSQGVQKKQSKLPVVLALLLVLLGVGGGVLWNKTALFDPIKASLGFERAPTQEEIEARRAANLQAMVGSLGMRNLRQYYVNNEKIGKIMVFEGRVVNEFDEPRELIRVEIELYDDTGALQVTKSQLAGTMVSFFQLQVLDQAELEASLTNRLDVLSNNINIPPGGTVQFMLVFYNPPENASSFEVKVIDARRPESAQASGA